MKVSRYLMALLLLPLAGWTHAADVVDFNTKVLPILRERCFECHSHAKKIRGGLALDSRSGWEKGGDNGPAIVPRNLEKSLLIQAVRRVRTELEMPPKAKLPAEELAVLEQWVKDGAPDPRGDDVAKSARTINLEEGKQFWSFRPIADPPLPTIRDAGWPLDPLDRFLLAKLEGSSLRPVPDATRYAWLRRVSLDLTGLPPTSVEIADFVKDTTPTAYAKVVDRLLASPSYGERWARHWLDLTGYADMMGTSNNVYAEHAWRYRDYLIAAFNKDKPFDRFVREQIAGDLLPTAMPVERAENITATGFLMVGDVEIVEPDKAKLEADHIDTQVSKIGTVFLGMTLGCVRCHDHKFDPVELRDYYGIAGMLRSSPSTHKIPFGVWSKLNATVLPETPEQLAARQKREADHEAKIVEMKGQRAKREAERKSAIAELAKLESQEKSETNETLAKRREELTAQLKTIDAAIRHAEFFRSQAPEAFAMRDGEKPADMPIYIRGNPYAPGAVVQRGVVRVASWEKPPTIPKGQSGRLQLADWLADKRNPLTARVIVNRIWQKLFGEGLVRSVDYFGTRGEKPSHPELLDHLATRFLQQGWSQKQLIRSLVLSRAYRLSSTNDATALKVDPDNRLLWRMNRQRLDAEAIRDGLLAVSGELIPSQGGPSLVLEYPENCGDLVRKGVNPPNYNHRKPRPSQEFQRSIYLPVMRTNTTNLDRIRNAFDFVNPAQIAGQRAQTVVPTQSLFVMNNDLFRKRAKVLADRLIADVPNSDDRLAQLWLRVCNRPITEAEQTSAATFLTELDAVRHEKNATAQESLKWQELCHSLLASNEFLFRF